MRIKQRFKTILIFKHKFYQQNHINSAIINLEIRYRINKPKAKN
jgi:hypothetical protein